MCKKKGHVRRKKVRTRRARYQGDAEPDTGAGATRRGAKRRCRRADSGGREGGTTRDACGRRPLRKFLRFSRRAPKNASRVGGGQERRPVRASAAPSSNAFRAASENFSSAFTREIQRADTPAVNRFWRMYAFCSSGPGLLIPLRRRSIESSSTRQ
jgi:hypothetical protein